MFGVILGTLSTLSNLYICRFIYKLIKKIENLNTNQKKYLIHIKPENQINTEFIYW